ncbi:MAG: ribonuclease BN [Ignavibacteria bacterium]|nr:MAG: ribonuclease BN [Ignavibacteria bacterium]KAF0155892.1 MAG: ribonuclease BN [Ignavibacteria bacterium]
MLKFKILKKIASYVSLTTVKRVFDFIDYYFINLFRRMDQHNLFFAGAGISFSLFLGMIPFILLIFSILGNVFDQKVIETQINNFIDQSIPYPAYANYIKKLISSRLPEVIEYKTSAFYIGIGGLLFTSTWIFSSIRTILNQIYDVKVERGFIYGMIRDIVMVVLLVFLISLSTFILPAINIIYELTKNTTLLQRLDITPIWNTMVYFSSLLLMFLLFFALYYLIPYEQLGKQVAAMSALWTTIFWEAARFGFGYYINNIIGTNPIYGAFVLIIAILFWVYYSACLFIVGAEIGQLYREKHNLKKPLR